MNYILTKRPDNTLTISFIGTETLNIGDRLILSLDEPLTGIMGFSGYTYKTTGENSKQYIKVFFTYKVGKGEWSEQLPIEQISTLEPCPTKVLDLKFYVYRVDDNNNTPTPITFTDLKINGTYKYTTTDSVATITNDNNPVVLKSKDIYKVFKLEDFQVITSTSSSNYSIQYRFTQDGGKTYTKWEPLTKENISTLRLNELRFAQVEYLIEKTGPASSIKIYDIILKGDFQNVSANSLKTNKYGVKQDCVTAYLNSNNPNGLPGVSNNLDTNGLSCYGDTISSLSNQDKSGYWKPYESEQISNFANLLANQVSDMLGFDVDYYLTDPDVNGQDPIMHEYQLYNVIDNKPVRVLVPDNKFPDNTIKVDQFNLDLFETFEIHITKDEFKSKFGIEKRPSEKDFLYFCQTNRMYYIKHAQIFKNVMNMGIYYKIILEKYETKANIKFAEEATKEKVQELTKNTTIDDLFGFEAEKEMDKIANKDQLYPKSKDKIRTKVSPKVEIIKENILNGTMNFITGYYNLAPAAGITAVEYKKADNKLEVSDNRSFICWFNFNNAYNPDKALTNNIFDSYNVDKKTTYTLLDNYDTTNKKGYRITYNNGRFSLLLNTQTLTLNYTGATTNIWYGLVINLEQRQGVVDIKLYQRNTYYEITMFDPSSYEKVFASSLNPTGYTQYLSQGFKPVENIEYNNGYNEFLLLAENMLEMTPTTFEHTTDITLPGSNIKYTNLRIFKDVVNDDVIQNILAENIITDAGWLILADNSNQQIKAENHKNINFR